MGYKVHRLAGEGDSFGRKYASHRKQKGIAPVMCLSEGGSYVGRKWSGKKILRGKDRRHRSKGKGDNPSSIFTSKGEMLPGKVSEWRDMGGLLKIP